MKSLSIILVVLVLSIVSEAQLATDREWMLDVKSCPVRLGINSGNNSVILTNTSGVTVSQVLLALVLPRKNGYQMVSKVTTVREKLEDGIVLIHRAETITEAARFGQPKNAKVAIVSVTFADGSNWRLVPP
ncbi:MAG: hypothetical protein DMF63_07320 [Acidobacteria bacterium]|nr:MAG: hypothetical protein DMF63_07320 [Acidobacteriota bacterium]